MIFECLRLIDEPVPGDGAWNMAVDEMLTREVAEPTLRVYRWSEPTVTMGYFEKLEEARRLRPGLPLMRRWTGGGLVDHGDDLTYSLIVPAGHRWAAMDRGESYCAIHRSIREIFAKCRGLSLELATRASVEGEGCFVRPVPGDLLLNGRKIAGAAQRRTRSGLLHQGSIQNVQLEILTGEELARGFSMGFEVRPLTAHERVAAAALAGERYGRSEWLARF